MIEKSATLFAGLYAALRSALRSVRDKASHSHAPAPRGDVADAPPARVGLQPAQPAAAPAPLRAAPGASGDGAARGLDVGVLQLQLDLLVQHFAEQAHELEGLDVHVHDPEVVHAAVRGKLESIKAHVRQRRARIAARTAEQIGSARHIETRARRLEARLESGRARGAKLLELELAIARADASLSASQVELVEERSQLAARERELTQCTTECALLREQHYAVRTARPFAESRVERLRARLAQMRAHAGKLRALDAPMRSQQGAAPTRSLSEVLAQSATRLDALTDCLTSATAPPGAPAEAALQLDTRALRAQLQHRVRLLEALAELRVEEAQTLHAARPERVAGSHAALARVNGTRIRLLLDDAERAWLLEALQAVEHEQAARLEAASGATSRTSGDELTRAVLAWRRCDERLEAAALQTRATQLELATLRGALAPELARAEATGRELGALVRQRQAVLRNRNRSAERARSRLVLTRERGRSLATRLQRARGALERAYAHLEQTPLRAALTDLSLLESDLEPTATFLAGLYAAHQHCARAIAATEAALHDLANLQRAAAAPAALDAQAADEPWAQARMELDIAALAEELERWKTRHADLEQRVEAQARALSTLEIAHSDETFAALRLDVEQARRSAAASLARALALHVETPGTGRTRA